MADQLQLRGGTTAENLLFTGAPREVVVDTDANSLRVHNGITQGGFAVPTEAMITDGTDYFNEDFSGGSAANSYILAPKVNTNVPTGYLDGIQLGFVATLPNTGPSTANFANLGVKNIKYPGGIDPAAGDISGRVNFVYDATNGWLELQKKPSVPQPQIRTVSASIGGNAMTVTVAPAAIDFRSPTPGSGVINSRNLTTSSSLTIPAGATLGTANGVKSKIAILAIDNAGTVITGVVNVAGGTNLDETTLINTTAISAAASSASTIYASSAVSGVPFRVMGYVDSTQAVAGTWQSVPSAVQGQGGQAIISPTRIFSSEFVSTEQSTTVGGQLIIAHGLTVNGAAAMPKLVIVDLINKTSEAGYTPGMIVSCTLAADNGSANDGLSVVRDATNITIRLGSTGGLPILNYTTGAVTRISPGSWRIIVRAWA